MSSNIDQSTKHSLIHYMSQLFPVSWTNPLLGKSELNNIRRPRVVPLKFRTNHIRKQYRLKQSTLTWADWIDEHKSTLIVLLSLLLMSFILYIKWHDARVRRNSKKAHHHLQ